MSEELTSSVALQFPDTGQRRFVIRGMGGRNLLEIDLRTGAVTGEIEDAGDAAAVFVESVRGMLKSADSHDQGQHNAEIE